MLLQKNKYCGKNKEKSNLLFTSQNNLIDSWLGALSGFCRFRGNISDSSDNNSIPNVVIITKIEMLLQV